MKLIEINLQRILDKFPDKYILTVDNKELA